MKPKSTLTLLTLLLLLPSIVIAADVTLAWDPVVDADIAEYRVYPRESGEPYDYQYDYEVAQTTQCILTGFDASKSYYFVVRAIDTDGNMSGDSNEVNWDPSGTGDGTALSLDGDAADGAQGGGGCFVSTLVGD